MKMKVDNLSIFLIFLILFFFLFSSPVQSSTLVSGSFYDTDLQEVIRSIAAQTGTTIVMDDVVTGTASVEFDQVPVEKALAMVLSPGGYTFRKMNDYYVVSTAHISNPGFKSISSTFIIKPRYIDISRINELLSPDLASYTKVDRGRNLLLVTAPPVIARRIEDIISGIDKPPVHIMVQALAVEITREKGIQLGTNWQWIGGEKESEAISVEGLAVDYTARDIVATISALVARGKVKILSNPQVLTLEGVPTQLQFGTQRHFQILKGTEERPYFRFETVTTMTEIDVRPYLTFEGEVMLDLHVVVEDLTEEAKVPRVTRRSARTIVKTQAGQTIAIAGLSEEVQREMKRKIWGVGDIPLADILFTRKYVTDRKTELVIFITPYVLQKELPSAKVALAAATWNTWSPKSGCMIESEQFNPKIYLGLSGCFSKAQGKNQYKAEIGCAPCYGRDLSGNYGLFERERYKLSFFEVRFQNELTEIRKDLYISFSYRRREGEPQASSEEEKFQQNVYSLSLKEINSINRNLRLMGEVKLTYVEEGGEFSPAIHILSGGPVYYLGGGLSFSGRYDYIWSKQEEYSQKGYALEIEYIPPKQNWTFTAGYRNTDQKNIRYMVGMEPPAKGYYASIKFFLK